MPKRIQMSRRHPWRTDNPDAVIVARPSRWGNPFRVYRCACCDHWDVIDDNGVKHHVDHAVARGEASPVGIVLNRGPEPVGDAQRLEAVDHAVDLFRQDIGWGTAAVTVDQIRAELAGRDLACWCPLDQPCHAAVLLAIANEEQS